MTAILLSVLMRPKLEIWVKSNTDLNGLKVEYVVF